jgi:hypothetical protein
MQYAQERIDSTAPSLPGPPDRFRFDDAFIDQPSVFEFRFIAGDRVFTYGMDLRESQVVGEWLTVLDGAEDFVVFERDAEGRVVLAPESRLSVLADHRLARCLAHVADAPLRTDQLALRRVIELPADFIGATLHGVTAWLRQGMVVAQPWTGGYDWLRRAETEPRVREFAEAFLQRIDTGIEQMRLSVEERDRDEWAGPRPEVRAVFGRGGVDLGGGLVLPGEFREVRSVPGALSRVVDRRLLSIRTVGGRERELDVSEESDGTRQLLRFLPMIAGAGGNGSTHIVDELDGSLHPAICREFLRTFAESCPDSHRQLIVTTHEAHLLDTDLLRRDEYWMVEKDRGHQTRLVSLSDFDVPDDFPLRRGYLQGRFGGVPRLRPEGRVLDALNREGAELEGVAHAP